MLISFRSSLLRKYLYSIFEFDNEGFTKLMTTFLNAEQLSFYEKNGYLVIEDFFNETVEELRMEAKRILEEIPIEEGLVIKFTTDDDNHVSDSFFLSSGDKVRPFFEEKAIVDGKLMVPKEKAINKIGHALHELNPVFKSLSLGANVAAIARDLGYASPAILQSMIIFKQPDLGSSVPPHVDSTFLYTDPPSATGLWFALEDCTLSNGCMYFAPGSHKQYKLSKRFVRNTDGKGTKMVLVNDEMHSGKTEPAENEYVAAPVKKGSLVLIHGLIHHKSGPNTSPKSRWIYTFHMIESSLPYPEDNWLQIGRPFTRLY